MRPGDIYLVDLDPTRGTEQAGKRYVVVVSQTDFNQTSGNPIIAPITQGGEFARSRGFTVPLTGAGTLTQGVVLCHQLRVLDLKTRGARFVERLPDPIVQDIIHRIFPIFEG